MKPSRLNPTLLLALVLSVTPVSVANAQAPLLLPAKEDPLPAELRQQIRNLVNESLAASAKSDWQAAQAALIKAWGIRPMATLAANLGYVEIKLGQYRQAAEHLQFFLDKAQTSRSDQRTAAEQQLAECRKHLAAIEVSASVDGTQVSIDGTDIGTTPLPTRLWLEPGTHTVKARRAGYQSESRSLSVEAGGDATVQFELTVEPVAPPQPAPVAPATTTRSQAPTHPGIQPRTWVLVGGSAATALGLGIAIGFHLRANSLESDANTTKSQIDALSLPPQRSSNGPCADPTGSAIALCDQLHSTRVAQDHATNVSTGGFIAAGVLAVATATTYLLWPHKRSKPSAPTQAAFGLAPLCIGKTQGLQFYSVF